VVPLRQPGYLRVTGDSPLFIIFAVVGVRIISLVLRVLLTAFVALSLHVFTVSYGALPAARSFHYNADCCFLVEVMVVFDGST